MLLLDTYAWVEYFKGSQKGKIVEEYLSKEEIITPTIVLIELSCKSVREDWDFEEQLDFIKSKSLITGINEDIIIKCGKVCFEQKNKKPRFGICDAIILTTAINLNAKVLTGDEHFRDLDEAVMLK